MTGFLHLEQKRHPQGASPGQVADRQTAQLTLLPEVPNLMMPAPPLFLEGCWVSEGCLRLA